MGDIWVVVFSLVESLKVKADCKQLSFLMERFWNMRVRATSEPLQQFSRDWEVWLLHHGIKWDNQPVAYFKKVSKGIYYKITPSIVHLLDGEVSAPTTSCCTYAGQHFKTHVNVNNIYLKVRLYPTTYMTWILRRNVAISWRYCQLLEDPHMSPHSLIFTIDLHPPPVSP